MLRSRFLVVFVLFAAGAPTRAYADESSYEPIVIEPAPGREVVGKLDLSFCKGIKTYYQDKSKARARLKRSVESAQKWGFQDKASALVTGLCPYSDDPGFREQLRYVVQLVVNQTGRSTEGAIESLVARDDYSGWRNEKKRGCDALEAPEDHTELDTVLYLAKLSAVGCKRSRMSASELARYVERTGDSASELARLQNATNCVPRGPCPPDRASECDSRMLIGKCGPLVRALDRAKLDKETAKMTVPLQVVAREDLAQAKAGLSDLEREAKAK